MRTVDGEGWPALSIFTRENGFVEESGLAYSDEMLSRLNKRHRLFMVPNAGRFMGKRVLDIASHDGRWCFASVKNGADHVTGVEYRQELIDKSSFILKPGVAERVKLVQGDIFDELPRLHADGLKIDIITCLGIFYHILDHHRLLKLMHAFKPELIIIDSLMVDSAEKFVRISQEKNTTIRNVIPDDPGRSRSPIGVMSVGGLRLLAQHFGYKMRQAVMAKADLVDKKGVEDYAATHPVRSTRRYAFLLEPVTNRN